MRIFVTAAVAVLLSLNAAQANRTPAPPLPNFVTLQSTTDWINAYRVARNPAQAPAAIRALSQHGALRDPETSGSAVGFIAGLIATNHDRAETLIAGMFPIRAEDQWAIVRGIAYSGAPRWKQLLREAAPRMPSWQVMIEHYLDDKLPTLHELTIKPSPTTMQRMRDAFVIEALSADSGKPKKIVLEPTQTVIDTLWGFYLASGSYGPILKLVEFLPWALDKDDAEKLTVGSMAKYTLAMNAQRDPELLGKLKHLRKARQQSSIVVTQLDEVIRAAETADPGTLRKNALAAIEQIKIKGPNYKRELSTWGKVGQGAIAVGCVVAAVTGHIEFGLPCVIGGGASTAAMYYITEK